MAEPRLGELRFLLAGAFYRLAYRAFGDPALPTLLCVHGLTRTARDFDVIAGALSNAHHVVAVDLPGRGASDWLSDARLYHTTSYVVALSHLMAVLGGPIDYLGTSLGGICGMELAAAAHTPIRRFILNDVGPLVPADALRRIRDYLTAPMPRFADVNALRLYLRRVHAPFGPLTDAQWMQLAQDSARPLRDGGVALHYDPGIAQTYAANPIEDLDMWHWWSAISAPMLTIRGASSDVLTPDTFAIMAEKSATLTVPNTGHAPALLDPLTIETVRGFLAGGR